MDKQKIDKGIAKLEASLKSSGVDADEILMTLMREKMSGELSSDDFVRGIRERFMSQWKKCKTRNISKKFIK